MSKSLILYVEDEESDIMLLQFALQSVQVTNPFRAVTDGEAALAYLKGTGPYRDRNQHPLPGLVLLDLNIPRVPGIKVLEWIRQQPQFAHLPVVIYSSSDDPRDKERTHQLGANDYIVKPFGIDKTISVLQKMKERWLDA